MKIIDLVYFFEEFIKYRKFKSKLFWFQKYKGTDWVLGQNFGDYLSVIIVAKLAKEAGYKSIKSFDNKLLAVGSILHFANDGDIIWGSGVNGKIDENKHNFTTLDVRLVRGPLTKKFLKKKDIKVTDNFGDPALLLPYLFPKYKYHPIKKKIIVIPNLNEYEDCKSLITDQVELVSPLRHWKFILKEILSSEIVYTSSLHGLILAEAFNVPVVLFKPFGGETMFKYKDYLEGTKRKLEKEPKTFKNGMIKEHGVMFKKPIYNKDGILNTFPYDKFER